MKPSSVLRLTAAALGIAAMVSAIPAITATAAPSKGNPAEGKKIFTVKCVACHKPDGTGGVKLTGNPTPNWHDKKRMATITDDYLRDCITNGKAKSGMVAWGKTGQIKPAEIENLIAFIRTFSK